MTGNEKDFIITKVSWITQMKSDPPSTAEEIKIEYMRYEVLFYFLQDNDLTIRILLKPGETANDETELRVSDLTEDGFKVIKSAYDKWLRKIDRAKDKIKAINDLSLLERALEAIRKS